MQFNKASSDANGNEKTAAGMSENVSYTQSSSKKAISLASIFRNYRQSADH
jgi:hypothetical protein